MRAHLPARFREHAVRAWSEGYWVGIGVGAFIGLCAGLVLAHAGSLYH